LRARTHAARLAHLLLLTLLVAGMVLPARAVHAQEPPVAPAATTDVPVPIVTEQYSAYYLAAGMLYYADYCFAAPIAAAAGAESAGAEALIADRPPTAAIDPAAVASLTGAYLKRVPVNGGFSGTVASVSGGAPECYRYKLLTADADGVFYDVRTGDAFNELPLRIEFRPGGTSGAPIVVANTTTATYPTGQRMASDATYIYWATATGVVRARKDGTSPAPEIVADGIAFPTDILVVGTTLYIADETGIFRIPTSGAGACPQPAGPCAETTHSTTGGTDLTYHFFRGTTIIQRADQIYWTAGSATTRRIRRVSCSQFAIGCSEGDVYNAPNDGQNWYIGRTAFYGDTMFWQDSSYNTGSAVSQGFLRRMALGGTPQILASPISTNADPVFVDGPNVFFRGSNYPAYSIDKLSVLAAPLTWDLRADALEVTQGIQNTANAAPLIARKTTYVRAFGVNGAGTRANNVTAWLYGSRGGSPLPGSPLKPINNPLSLALGGTWDRARINDGWLYQIPASWTAAGQTNFRLVVDPAHVYTDSTPANNELTRALNFQNEAPACAVYVPVRTHNPRTSTNMPNFWDMVGRFQRLWPVANVLNFTTSWQAEETQVCWYGPFPYPCGGPFELDEGASISDWIPDKDEVIAELWAFNVFNDAPACDAAGGYTHIMGMVHPQAPTGNTAGYASTISAESWVKLPPATPNPFPNTWNGMFQSAVMAQELAHNYGRKHINCGNPGDIDGGYPYPANQIANTGQTSYYGFDTKTRTPIAPNAATDYMTYCNNNWSSDYTWRSIISNNVAVAQSASPDAALIISAEGTVFASGHIDTAEKLGQINDTRVLPAGSMSSSMTQKLLAAAVADYTPQAQSASPNPSPDHGGEPHADAYHIRLIGAGDVVLADKAVTLLPIDDHDPARSAQIFVASFPAPAGQVLRVELLESATLLDSTSPGPGQPVVAISQPSGGTIGDSMTVAWTASDPDADPLIFTLQYSYDGGTTWQALANDVPSTPNPNYQVTLNDLSALHGSAANAGRVRVIATDGFNTTIATSQPFTLSNRKPTAFITDPSGQTYDPQAAVTMQGGASDAEDGVLDGAALTWKVGATVVGSGADVTIMGMAPGVYTATLEAKDSTNNVDAASAPLRVAPLSIPLGSAATMDGDCNDLTYASGSHVILSPYNDADKSQASLRLVRDANYLYGCFSGLKKGASTPGAFVGLRFDVNNSRDPLAQSSDYGFFVGEDGTFYTNAGNGAGGFAQPGPGGLQAQITADANGTSWNAELRINKSTLGGWDRLVGMKAGHYWVASQGDDYGWPYAAPTVATYNAPNTWARTALGLLPVIDAVTPLSMTVGSPTVVISVTGENFDPGAVILWNGTPLPTAAAANAVAEVEAAALSPDEEAATQQRLEVLVLEGLDPDAVVAAESVQAAAATSVLSAQVPAALLTAAGGATLTVRNPGPIESTPVTLAVNNAAPRITTLSPAQKQARTAAFVLTVNGSAFVNGATVYWDGVALPTTFVNSSKVTAQVAAGLLDLGNQAGITVRNPAPSAADSNTAIFAVTPNLERFIFLPAVQK
jgi:hypothetical protein